MALSFEDVKSFVRDHYNLDVSVQSLPGEIDLNYQLETSGGTRFILKVANLKEEISNLELQNAVMDHLTRTQSALIVSSIVKSVDGKSICNIPDEGNIRLVRVLTWVEGRPFATVQPKSPALLQRLGEMCGNLCTALASFDHPSAHRFMKWDPRQTSWVGPHLQQFSGERKALALYFYSLFQKNALPLFPQLRMSVNYNDANDYNVLVSSDENDPKVPGVIDFGDVVYTHTVNELAIGLAYAVMGKSDPLEAAFHVVKGFHDKFKLSEAELRALFPLMTARLLISVTCSELNRIENPENVYLQISDQHAWTLLEKLKSVSPAWAEYIFRSACGLLPCPEAIKFNEWISTGPTVTYPVENKNFYWLDLSVGSLDLGNSSDLNDPHKLNQRISSMIQNDNRIALGKYDEVRSIYSTQAYEKTGNDGSRWRTVHIGIDFFCSAGSLIKAVFQGTVHSFANNASERDYGPTIILEHRVSENFCFYTLYGHLNIECLQNLTIGQQIKTGEVIAQVGHPHENGNWTPHLHFQIMLNTLGMKGDFPGVCFPDEDSIWKSLCPDPWQLLTGYKTPALNAINKDEIVTFRKQHIGKNLSISYKDPIKIVRGAGQYLIDDRGRRYLDTVNNVAHIGHEHPRVVAAGQRQMAVLNTNTRYLHENLVHFTGSLLSTLPGRLNVAFMVNSGSEANELALRLAKNQTGQEDMIVSQVGYHGNTNGCIEISSYKFDGKGGKGKAKHIHVIPIPDTYRGLYRALDPEAGHQYALHVKHSIEQMQAEKRNPAALIFEAVISCGGQVELPPGFLKEAYRYVRSAGGVCIADEVQTGCGRSGSHYWAFQQHDVEPDIVTIGKPIGNGHPLGVVVTTQEIADAFKNGMEYFNTFGGNPVSCAIGLEVLQVIHDEKLQQNAEQVGKYLKAEILKLGTRFEVIGDVRGPGLFLGIELIRNRTSLEPATAMASYLANRMRDKGILMSTDGPFDNVMKIKPPLVFNKTDADFLLHSLELVFNEDFMQPGLTTKK